MALIPLTPPKKSNIKYFGLEPYIKVIKVVWLPVDYNGKIFMVPIHKALGI